jgi:hypothetical protein
MSSVTMNNGVRLSSSDDGCGKERRRISAPLFRTHRAVLSEKGLGNLSRLFSEALLISQRADEHPTN